MPSASFRTQGDLRKNLELFLPTPCLRGLNRSLKSAISWLTPTVGDGLRGEARRGFDGYVAVFFSTVKPTFRRTPVCEAK